MPGAGRRLTRSLGEDDRVMCIGAVGNLTSQRSAQNCATVAASWASKLTPNTVVFVMIVYLSVWGRERRSYTAVRPPSTATVAPVM